MAEEVTIHGDRFPVGAEVRATVLVLNHGGTHLPEVLIRFRIEDRPPQLERVVSLPAGRTSRIDVTLLADRPGEQALFVMVDPENHIPETDKQKNIREAILRVDVLAEPETEGEPVAGPRHHAVPDEKEADLAIISFHLNKRQVKPEETVTVSAAIRNLGPHDIEGVPVRFHLEENPIGEDQWISLGVGDTEEITADFTAGRTGDYAVLLMVDPEASIIDPDRENNYGERVLAVRMPSMVEPETSGLPPEGEWKKSGASVPPQVPMAWPGPSGNAPNLVCTVQSSQGILFFDGKTVPVKVRNMGKAPVSKSTTIGIKEAGVYSWQPKVIWLAKGTVQSLPVGGSVTVNVSWPHKANTKKYVAVADIDNLVDEGTAEQDNTSAPFSLALMPKMIPVAASGLKIQKPAAGKYFRGGRMEIIWKATGQAKGAGVNIGLPKGGSQVQAIAYNGPPQGDWSYWDIPQTIAKGQYAVAVKTTGPL